MKLAWGSLSFISLEIQWCLSDVAYGEVVSWKVRPSNDQLDIHTDNSIPLQIHTRRVPVHYEWELDRLILGMLHKNGIAPCKFLGLHSSCWVTRGMVIMLECCVLKCATTQHVCILVLPELMPFQVHLGDFAVFDSSVFSILRFEKELTFEKMCPIISRARFSIK